MSDTIHSATKRLNQMNTLADMGQFPPLVHAGATFNVLATTVVTWFVQPYWQQPWAPVAWIALVLAINLSPVLLLRLTLTPNTAYPTLAQMDFFRDQHKFADWVYVAASANMAFWTLGTWAIASLAHSTALLAVLLLIEFLLTFAPVYLRRL